jgi:copper chaperone
VQVDLNKSQATLAVQDGSEVKDAEIEQAVKEAGFTPGSIECEAAQRVGRVPAFFKSTAFNVSGMRCEHCAANITAALKRQTGVHSAAVDLGANRATVIYDPQQVKPSALVQAIEHAGKFRATMADVSAKHVNAD